MSQEHKPTSRNETPQLDLTRLQDWSAQVTTAHVFDVRRDAKSATRGWSKDSWIFVADDEPRLNADSPDQAVAKGWSKASWIFVTDDHAGSLEPTGSAPEIVASDIIETGNPASLGLEITFNPGGSPANLGNPGISV